MSDDRRSASDDAKKALKGLLDDVLGSDLRADVKAAQTALEVKATANETASNTLGKELQVLHSEIEGLQRELGDYRGELEELVEGTEDKLGGMTSALDALKGDVNANREALTAGLVSTTDSVEAGFKTERAQLVGLEKGLADLDCRLDNMESAQRTCEALNKGAMEILDTQMRELAQATDTLRGQLDALKAGQESVDKQLPVLLQGVKQLPSLVDEEATPKRDAMSTRLMTTIICGIVLLVVLQLMEMFSLVPPG
jgi:chromosome segregation ATPase